MESDLGVPPEEDKYKGYRINDLSNTLQEAMGKRSETESIGIGYVLPSLDWLWLNITSFIPSLHNTLVLIYFLLLVLILYGVSKYMFSRYNIGTRSSSEGEGDPEEELLGSGHFAQFVTVAVATKIYREEMARMHREGIDPSTFDSDNSSDGESDHKDNDNVDDHIERSTLIGGYQKSKKLRARTIRKQRLREQKEQYERYRKRVEFERKKKRYEKKKEKKEQRKLREQAMRERKARDAPSGWMHSVQSTITSILDTFGDGEGDGNSKHSGNGIDDGTYERKMEIFALKQKIKKDCNGMAEGDLERYYRENIESSNVFHRILPEFSLFLEMVEKTCKKNELRRD